jgi:hypothetical protein
METGQGEEIMQIRLKIALVAAGFALASFPVFAFDLPPDGTKNFSAPSDAPSYFSNETIPESDRVNHQATFDSQEVQESPSAPEVSQGATETEWRGRHAYRHAHRRYYGHGGSTHFARATSSGATTTATFHNTARQSYPLSHGARIYTPRHAKVGTRQHVATKLPTTA